MAQWLSVREAARILGVSPNTVLRSLRDDARRQAEWGAEGEGWRRKPLSVRGELQLRREWVSRKAGEL